MRGKKRDHSVVVAVIEIMMVMIMMMTGMHFVIYSFENFLYQH